MTQQVRRHRGTRWPAALAMGLVAALISVGRLWLANPAALAEVLWAEDGLFPLCVEKTGWLGCLFDPFAGYSIFLPRVLAGVTALFPESSWPMVVLVLGALLAGVTGALAFWWVRRFGLGVVAAVVIALLPVGAPIVGMEAVNVIASVYMLMLYLGALFLALPLDRYPTWPVAVFLLVSALTIPSTALLLGVLLVQVVVRSIRVRSALVLTVAVVIGLVVQWVVASGAARPRELMTSLDSLRSWVDAVPTAILTFWPGLNLGEVTVFTNYVSRPFVWTGWVVVVLLLAVGVWLLVGRSARRRGAGLLILSGLALGAFPSVIGYANNRYFVVPALLWAAALLVLLDPVIRRSRWWTVALVAAVVLVIWWPSIPASAWRTTPAPSWSDEVARVAAACQADPGASERPIFTPFWPPNWGDGLAEPSHPNLPCLIGRRWS